MNATVRPPASRRARASATSARTSATPLETALSCRQLPPARSASKRARVVLPEPGGPHSTIDGMWPGFTTRVSAPSGPTRCGCPTNSSSVRGRIRAASGAPGSGTSANSGSEASTFGRRAGMRRL
jgi:hypothetical protein